MATALTGEHHDPYEAVRLQGVRFRLPAVRSVDADGMPRHQQVPPSALEPRVRDLLLKDLAATSSMNARETEDEFPHESFHEVYNGDDVDEREAEHSVQYWLDLEAERESILDGVGHLASSNG